MNFNGQQSDGVPVVCIGLSAGGIAPLMEIFRGLASDTGMAFIVIHHLRRERPTALDLILSHCTRMPVQLACDGLSILPDHVYVLPSGDEIILTDGRFKIAPRTKTYGWPNVVSLFVDSLGRSRHPGIAIILSGMDGDGADALKKLRRHGGIVIAQSPSTASHPEMPGAAIQTGEVDYVLDSRMIGAMVTELARELQGAKAQ